MLGIGQDRDEITVAGNAAAIVGRAGIFSTAEFRFIRVQFVVIRGFPTN
jgi:hypothetical protein